MKVRNPSSVPAIQGRRLAGYGALVIAAAATAFYFLPRTESKVTPAPAVAALETEPETESLPTPDSTPAPEPVHVAVAPPAVAERALEIRYEPDSEGLADVLQAPIIKAVRARYPSQIARRDAMIAALESSGASRESWTRGANDVFEKWRSDAANDGSPVRVGATRCFRAGCESVATFSDPNSYQSAEERTAALDLGWKGAWMQTPPEQLPSGEVHVTWILLRPDAL